MSDDQESTFIDFDAEGIEPAGSDADADADAEGKKKDAAAGGGEGEGFQDQSTFLDLDDEGAAPGTTGGAAAGGVGPADRTLIDAEAQAGFADQNTFMDLDDDDDQPAAAARPPKPVPAGFADVKTMMDAAAEPEPSAPARFQDAKTFMDFDDDDDSDDDALSASVARGAHHSDFQDDATLMDGPQPGFQDDQTLMDGPGAEGVVQDAKTFMDFDDGGDDEPQPGFQDVQTLMDGPGAVPPGFQDVKTLMDAGDDGGAPGDGQTFMDFGDDEVAEIPPSEAQTLRFSPGQVHGLLEHDRPPVPLPPGEAARLLGEIALAPSPVATYPLAELPLQEEEAPDDEPPAALGDGWPFADAKHVVTHFGPRGETPYVSGEDAGVIGDVEHAVSEGGWPKGLTTLAEICNATSLPPDRAARVMRELAEASKLIFVEVPGGNPDFHYAVSR